MDEALYKLTSWLSPAYPVGAYTYSHGLEWAVTSGDVVDVATAQCWIEDCLLYGAGRTDAILLSRAHAAATDEPALREIDELARALAPTAERLLETEAQGEAFARVTETSWGGAQPLAYPVAIGYAAAAHGVPAEQTVMLFLHAFLSNMVSAAVRLVPLGQTEGQTIISSLMPLCTTVSLEALNASLDDIGGFAIRSDIASMRHETQEVRLFRS